MKSFLCIFTILVALLGLYMTLLLLLSGQPVIVPFVIGSSSLVVLCMTVGLAAAAAAAQNI